MEQKNNSGTLVGILIGIIIMLIVVGGLFATGTIGFKTGTNTDNGQTSENSQPNNSNTSQEQNSSIQEEIKKNYEDFIGTWENDKTLNNIKIKKVTDNEITFTWFLYRLAGIDDDTTISFENGKGVFYYQGTEEIYSEGKKVRDEEYKRKATIELTDNGVNVIVEDVSSIDSNYKILDNFAGSVYIKAGTYTHPTKVN